MIVATNNEGKLKEIRSILDDYELYSLKEKNKISARYLALVDLKKKIEQI